MTQTDCAKLETGGLIAAIVLGTIGALTIMVVPGMIMMFSKLAALTDQQLGYIAAFDINAMAAGMGIATFLVARFNWRHLALVGLAVFVAGNLVTAGVHSYVEIIAARSVVGLGEGLIVAVSFAALGSAANPDRAFGIYLVVGLLVSAGVLAAIPWLDASIGSRSVFVGIAGLGALTCVLLKWLPTCCPAAVLWTNGRPPIIKKLAVAGLVTVFIYFIAQGATWSYFERIGAASGVAPTVIGQALSISSVAGMAGALVAVSLCTRVSRAWLLIVSGGLSLVSFWMLIGHVTGAVLIVAGILFNFAWNLAQPLLSGVCAEADSCGRVVTAMGCIQTVGFGFGPAIAATLLTGNGFAPVTYVSTVTLLVSLGIILVGTRAPQPTTVLPMTSV